MRVLQGREMDSLEAAVMLIVITVGQEVIIPIEESIDFVEVGIVEGLDVGLDTLNQVALMSED